MERFDLLKDLAERTGGDVYLGFVGPVRTGKSTFIKRFMEMLVLPNITDPADLERAKDELPQSGSGRTVMTTEPKFIPNEAVRIDLPENISMKVRLVDCVGYAIDGALGFEEEDGPRMVITPWRDEPIPFTEAAELGTEKVIRDHSTIGIVVTTDGTVTELPRESYVAAEEKVIAELKDIEKPFVVVLNTRDPLSETAQSLQQELTEKYGVPVIPVNVMKMTLEDIYAILLEVLYEFPVQEINIELPRWVESLPPSHWLRSSLHQSAADAVEKVRRLRDIEDLIEELRANENVSDVILEHLELGTGVAQVNIDVPRELLMVVLSEIAGEEINTIDDLVPIMQIYAHAKREYDYIQDALRDARNLGYGIVPPRLDEMALEEPEIIRQGNRFGVRLRASAPAFHFVRVDVESEIAPIIGSEKQSEELIKYLIDEFETDPQRLWQSNIFGKSLHTLVKEGIQKKLHNMPDNAQEKLRETIQKIVNEGSGGLIAIIL